MIWYYYAYMGIGFFIFIEILLWALKLKNHSKKKQIDYNAKNTIKIILKNGRN
jgi:hypothetical protein